jgi:hypothetical protein
VRLENINIAFVVCSSAFVYPLHEQKYTVKRSESRECQEVSICSIGSVVHEGERPCVLASRTCPR